MNTLHTKINDLALKQALLKDAQDELAARRAAFEEENATLIREVVRLKAEAEVLRVEIQDQALAEFERTGNKKIGPGVGIREYKVLALDDEWEAIQWAMQKAAGLLTIRVEQYQKALENNEYSDQPGRIEKVAKATVSPDLNKYLAKEATA